jgi:hypothetical protein
MDKMDKLIFINKKWPFDPQIGYLGPINIASACQVEFDLQTKLKVEFENQNEGKDLLNFHDSS